MALAIEQAVQSKTEFLVKGKPCTVTYRDLLISWTNSRNKDKTEVSLDDILSVDIQCSRKDSTEIDTLNICYINHLKGHVLRRSCVTFSGQAEPCTQLKDKVTREISKMSQRPKKLLVLINPVSGRSKGRMVYTKKVAPIFEAARILTEVIVTERAHHTEEILATYDLKSIDGIVLVGGDGIYHEAVNGMMRRLMAETDRDVNDPEMSLPDLPLCFGLIPCGTGNGIAYKSYGNRDVETAALSIVLGQRCKRDMGSVFSSGVLVAYSVLLVGYGVWGDIIYLAESRRSQGIFRYPIAIGEILLRRHFRQMNLTIDCLAYSDESDNKVDGHDKDVSHSAELSGMIEDTVKGIQEEQQKVDKLVGKIASDTDGDNYQSAVQATESSLSNDLRKSQEEQKDNKCTLSNLGQSLSWKTITGTFTGIFTIWMMLRDALKTEATQPAVHVDYTSLIIHNVTGIFAFLKNMVRLMNNQMIPAQSFDHVILDAREWKVKLDNPSNLSSRHGQMEHVINIDGEVFHLKCPEYHAKLIPNKINFYYNQSTGI